ncbi:hypothetical protein BDW59DRAFT_141617 [Aspergillus cavernicola]|uniref:Amino acid permease/ SLC12A domain-containing protein n=1 Tax=Aspergillus cavernicola TaxID=176166 RepID=A0ABR4IT13_9EURO
MAIELRSDITSTLTTRQEKLATVRLLAPLKLMTVYSSLWMAGILAWGIVLGDGPAVIAIILISLSSSLHSAALYWYWQSSTYVSPRFSGVPGDLVLKTHEGGLVIVHCDEAVARLLYGEGVRCSYVVEPSMSFSSIWARSS